MRFSANIFAVGSSLTVSALVVVSRLLSLSSRHSVANQSVRSLYMLSESSSRKNSAAGRKAETCISRSLAAASVKPYLPIGAIARLLVGVEYIDHFYGFSLHIETWAVAGGLC